LGGAPAGIRASMTRFLRAIRALLSRCRHDGLSTPIRSFRGVVIWRCEACGGEILVADELVLARPD
jgi:hypothetical protein